MAELIGMFQPYDNKYGYRKAIVRTEDKVYFESLGFIDKIVTWDEIVSRQPTVTLEGPDQVVIEEKDSKPIVTDGAVAVVEEACGLPGSVEWDTASIKDLATKQEIADYVLEITGKKIDKRGNYDKFTERALAAIEAHHGRNSK